MRTCNKCKQEKTLCKENFHKDGSKNSGFAYTCNICWKIHKRPIEKEKYMMKHYGIGMDGYIAMFNKQNGCCAICNTNTEVLFIDHDHSKEKSNCVRSLLCRLCNKGIADFRENPDAILKAFHYIRFHKGEYT